MHAPGWAAPPSAAPVATPGDVPSPAILHKVTGATERQEMTVNTSRILTLDLKIPQAQVNNPEILELTPLAPNQIQVFAKKTGVTQVNLWDENQRVYTIDVIVFGDAQELSMVLRTEFPDAALRIRPVSNGVLISGFVPEAEQVSSIVRIAEEYYPKVIPHMKVGGVQQVLLHLRVMEVSRTKLRAMGFDFAQLSNGNMNSLVRSGVGSLIGVPTDEGKLPISTSSTFQFGVVDGNSAFFGVLEAMRKDNMMKILSEPTLVTVSGRPAQFLSGGSVPVMTGGGLGIPANTEYKDYGTQIDFVPIVLGNGKIRLEVRPEISEVDESRSLESQPAFRVRKADTGVEMAAGQTLAIAGLIQTVVESQRKGLPWVSEVPYVGALFRRVEEQRNEVEVLIMVTPELVDPMDPDEVPPCGPGMETDSPSDWELYMKGYIEVPKCCPNGQYPGPAPGRMLPAGPAPGPGTPLPPPSGATGQRTTPATAAQASVKNSFNRQNRTATSSNSARQPLPSFKGPVGYDVVK
jgi:pilus assembly protein CpaC